MQEQQAVTHRTDFSKSNVDEEALMQIIAGGEPAETVTEQSKPLESRTQRQAKENQSMYGRKTTIGYNQAYQHYGH